MNSPPPNPSPGPAFLPSYHRQQTLDETRNRRRAQRSKHISAGDSSSAATRSSSIQPSADRYSHLTPAANTSTGPTEELPDESTRQTDSSRRFAGPTQQPVFLPSSPIEKSPQMPDTVPPLHPLSGIQLSESEGMSGVPLPSREKSTSPSGPSLEPRSPDEIKPSSARRPLLLGGGGGGGDGAAGGWSSIPKHKKTDSVKKNLPSTKPARKSGQPATKTDAGSVDVGSPSAPGLSSKDQSEDGVSTMATAGSKTKLEDTAVPATAVRPVTRTVAEPAHPSVVNGGYSQFGRVVASPAPFEDPDESRLSMIAVPSSGPGALPPIKPFSGNQLPRTPPPGFKPTASPIDRSPMSPFPETPTPPKSLAVGSVLASHQTKPPPKPQFGHGTRQSSGHQRLDSQPNASPMQSPASQRRFSTIGADDDDRRKSGLSTVSVSVKSPLQQLESSLKDGARPIEVRKRGYRRYPTESSDEASGSRNSSGVQTRDRERERERERDPSGDFSEEILEDDTESAAQSMQESSWGDIRRRVGNAKGRHQRQGSGSAAGGQARGPSSSARREVTFSPPVTIEPRQNDQDTAPYDGQRQESRRQEDQETRSSGRRRESRNKEALHGQAKQVSSQNNDAYRYISTHDDAHADNRKDVAHEHSTARAANPDSRTDTHSWDRQAGGSSMHPVEQAIPAPANNAPPSRPSSYTYQSQWAYPSISGNGSHEVHGDGNNLNRLASLRRQGYRPSPLPDLSYLTHPDARFASESTSTVGSSVVGPQEKLQQHRDYDSRQPTHQISDFDPAAPPASEKDICWPLPQESDVRGTAVSSARNSLYDRPERHFDATPQPQSFHDIEMGKGNAFHIPGMTSSVVSRMEQPALFNPQLYLKCGPLLRFCGIQSAGMRNEVWRGSALIVTLDDKSVYYPSPSLRLFYPSSSRNTRTATQRGDDIAGTIKPSRIGKTLYVRPASELIPGANLSAVENDHGLFQEGPVSDEHEQDDDLWTQALAADRSGSFTDIRGTRLLSDNHSTFWRFEINIPLNEACRKIGYRVNLGPPLAFHVPAKGQAMRMAVHSRNGISENVKPRLNDKSNHQTFDSGNDLGIGLPALCGPDPMWRDILNTHLAEPFHVLVGTGGQVVLDAAVKETVWFGDWWRRRAALANGQPEQDMKRPESRRRTSIQLDSRSGMASNGDLGAPSGRNGLKGSASVGGRKQPSMSVDMRAELELFFSLSYSASFSHGLVSLGYSMIPAVNAWSDEGDGFRAFECLEKISPDLRSDPVVVEAWRIALKYYLLFQHHTLIEGDPAYSQSWIQSPFVSSVTRLPSRSFFLHLGKPIAFLSLDTCSDRDGGKILQSGTYDSIFARLRNEVIKGETRHLIVSVGGPMVFPRRKKNLGDKSSNPSRRRSVTRAIAGLLTGGGKQRRESSNTLGLSALPASWTDAQFTAERRSLIHLLQQFAREKNVRVTFLSCSASAGVASVGQFISREQNVGPRGGIPKHADFRYMPAIVTPSTAAAPVGPSVISELEINTTVGFSESAGSKNRASFDQGRPARQLSQSSQRNPRMLQFLQSSLFPLDGATDESMIPLFEDGTDFYSDYTGVHHESEWQNLPYFMHRRGWCSISEFVPGKSPVPSVRYRSNSHSGSDGDDYLSDEGTAVPSVPERGNRLSRLFSVRRKSVSEGSTLNDSISRQQSVESWQKDGSQQSGGRRAVGRPMSTRGGGGAAPPRSFFNSINCVAGRDGPNQPIPADPAAFDGPSRPTTGIGSANGTAADSADCLPFRNSMSGYREPGASQVATIPSYISNQRGFGSGRNSLDTGMFSPTAAPNPFRRRATIQSSHGEPSPPVGVETRSRKLQRGRSSQDRGRSMSQDKPARSNSITRFFRRASSASRPPTSAEAGFSFDNLADQLDRQAMGGAGMGEEAGYVDLTHGLDIRFCIERRAGVPVGETRTYRMLVPALTSDDRADIRPVTGVRASMDWRMGRKSTDKGRVSFDVMSGSTGPSRRPVDRSVSARQTQAFSPSTTSPTVSYGFPVRSGSSTYTGPRTEFGTGYAKLNNDQSYSHVSPTSLGGITATSGLYSTGARQQDSPQNRFRRPAEEEEEDEDDDENRDAPWKAFQAYTSHTRY